MKYNILIADDEERIITNMSKVIGDAFGGSVEIKTASNGLECLKILRSFPVDLLISDIRMPGLNGIELVKEVRETLPGIQILIISAYEDFSYAKQLIPYRIMDYLIKPISVEHILDNVKKAMAQGGASEIRESEIKNTREEKYHVNTLIKKAEEFIENKIYSPVSLSDVADYLHVNKSYLSAIFKNEAGENISNYINEQKIKEAKKLLLKSDMPVSEIAEKLGYNSSKYFIEKFSKSTGITPHKYRGLLNKSIR